GEHARAPLAGEQLDESIEVLEVGRDGERAAQRVRNETTDRIARSHCHRSGRRREWIRSETSGWSALPKGIMTVAPLEDGGPVDTSLVAVVEVNLDDLRFQHDLTRYGLSGLLQVLAHIAKLIGHCVHDDDTGLWVDDHTATRPLTDQRMQISLDS